MSLAFENRHFRDTVIGFIRESGHLARNILQMAFCKLGTFALKSGFQRIKSISGLMDLPILYVGFDNLCSGLDSHLSQIPLTTKVEGILPERL